MKQFYTQNFSMARKIKISTLIDFQQKQTPNDLDTQAKYKSKPDILVMCKELCVSCTRLKGEIK